MRALAIALLLLSACGYSLSTRARDGEAYRVKVAPVREPAIDVDAGAEVQRAVNTAVARTSGFRLSESDDDYVLNVEILDLRAGLAPFADPGRRAAQYVARVTLRARIERGGRTVWTSTSISGEGRYLSTPGGVETLDGANRRSIARASTEAADRLLLAMRAALDDLRTEASR